MSPAAAIVLGLLFLNLATLIVLGREVAKRKRAENRLWGIATGQGLHPELSGDTSGMYPKVRPMDGGRLDQLESQMDLMAQQMDRLVESQEFLSRVLADRDRLPDPRLRTPH